MLFHNRAHRTDPGMPTRATVDDTWWSLWRTRQPPFRDLVDGTRIVLVDSWRDGGRLTWEVQATNVLTTAYASKSEAVGLVAKNFGYTRNDVRSETYTAEKLRTGPDTGYVLAWACKPVRRLALPRPPTMHFRRNGWLTESSASVLSVWGIGNGSTPSSHSTPKGQGRLSTLEKHAVDMRAMQLAKQWCRKNGWPIVDDVSGQKSWDLEARKRRNGQVLYVEVKGTIGSKPEVEVTRAEVEHALSYPSSTALVVFTDIALDRTTNPPTASGERAT